MDIVNVIKTSVGTHHGLILLGNGHVLSFGYGRWHYYGGKTGHGGRYGQLGHGNNENVERPQRILSYFVGNGSVINELEDAVDVSAGDEHSLILLRNGHVLSFGSGEYGKLGHGNYENLNRPRRIVSYSVGNGIEELEGAVDISAGMSHSLILLRNGHVLSFGRNDWGQLGLGIRRKYLVLKRYFAVKDKIASANIPQLIPSIEDAITVSAGGVHSLVLLRNGQVLSFGSDKYGQLGNMQYVPYERKKYDSHDPKIVPLGGQNRAIGISAGYMQSLVLLENGRVLAFGMGDNAQFGFGEYREPGLIPLLENITAVATGGNCSIFLRNDNRVLYAGFYNMFRPGSTFRDISLIGEGIIDGNVINISAGEDVCSIVTDTGKLYLLKNVNNDSLISEINEIEEIDEIDETPVNTEKSYYFSICSTADELGINQLKKLFDHLALPYLPNWSKRQFCEALGRESWQETPFTTQELEEICGIENPTEEDRELFTYNAYSNIERKNLVMVYTYPTGNTEHRKCYDISGLRSWLETIGCRGTFGNCADPSSGFNFINNKLNRHVLKALFAARPNDLERLRQEFFSDWNFAVVERPRVPAPRSAIRETGQRITRRTATTAVVPPAPDFRQIRASAAASAAESRRRARSPSLTRR